MSRRSSSSSRTSTFQFRRLVLLVDVNKVFSQDRVRLASRSLTFQPQVVEVLAVFLAFSHTAVQIADSPVLGDGGRLAGLHGCLSGQGSSQRTVERLVVAPPRGGPQLPPQFRVVSVEKGFSHFSFPHTKKVRPDLFRASSLVNTTTMAVFVVLKRRRRSLSTCPTASKGCSSVTTRARPAAGTGAPTRRSGSHLQASGSSGSARGLRREGSGTCTEAPVSVVILFLLCLLSEAFRGEGLGIPSTLLGCQRLWPRSSSTLVLWLVG